ncbi:PEGA domain-containing protein [bacterium]|nr:PEGA domain-containing protein [candidate division CSSED10-310 bacterium]
MRSFVFVRILLLFWITLPVFGQIQEEFLPQLHTLRTIAADLERLETDLLTLEPVEALARIDQLTQALSALKAREPDADRHIINRYQTRVYLVEMVIFYNQGDRQQAKERAERVFLDNPGVALSGRLASADCALWFEEIREQAVGVLTITSRPDQAVVFLNGREFGSTPLNQVFAARGNHEILIQKKGYTTWVGKVTVSASAPAELHVDLRKNAGTLMVWVSPPDAEISLDTLSRAIRTEPVHFSLYPLLLAMGFYPPAFSQPVIIDGIAPGERILRIESACYQPIHYRLQVDIGDYFLPIMALTPATAVLTIQSEPSNQPVYVDDLYLGHTPVRDAAICPGSRSLSVQFDAGRVWRKQVWIQENESYSFSAFPRPQVLFLGCEAADRVQALEGAVAMEQWFENSERFSLVERSRAAAFRYRPSVAGVFERMGQPGFDPSSVDWQTQVGNMTATVLETGATLVVFSRLVSAESSDTGYLILIRTDSQKPDILPLPPGSPESAPPKLIAEFLQQTPVLSRLRSGLRITTVGDHAVISEIIPGGPAETSPFHAGDRLIRLANQPVSSRIDAERILRDPELSEEIRVQVDRSGVPIEAIMHMPRQPVTLPLADPGIPYNLILTLIETVSDGELPSRSGLLNAGICRLALEHPAEALETFNRISELDPTGIGSGTLDYIKSIAARAIGQTTLAETFARSARQTDHCTFLHGDGPDLNGLMQ